MFIAVLAGTCTTVAATVEVYPGAAEQFRSHVYAVAIVDETGVRHEGFVYESVNAFRELPEYPGHAHMSTRNHWIGFAITGKVAVEVTRLSDTPIGECTVRPSRRGIESELRGGKVYFTVHEPGQYAVELDSGGRFVEEPLFIFADPPETDVPDLTGPEVLVATPSKIPASDPARAETIYFPPGVYNLVRDHGISLRDGYPLYAGDTVYIAAGAYVIGSFHAESGDNITLRGRGILSGLGEPWVKSKYRPTNPDAAETFSFWQHSEHLVFLKDDMTRGHVVRDLTFTDPTHFNVAARGQVHVDNIKAFGWFYCTDGVGAGDDSLIENSFFKCNDDTLKLYNSDMTVRNCVIWQQQNGAPFQFSWGLRGEVRNVRVQTCDIVRCDHEHPANNRAVFCCVHSGGVRQHRYVFDDICIEGDVFRLLGLALGGPGAIEDVLFRNVTVQGRILERNYLDADQGRIADLRFENLRVNGVAIDDASRLALDASGNVVNVTFNQSTP